MKIGVFTKTDMCGGSEMRAIELCNAIARHTSHDAYFLAERAIPARLLERVNAKVTTAAKVLDGGGSIDILYEMDVIVVVNTDSTEFTTLDYWEGRGPRHALHVDLRRIRRLMFLFNFIVSPSQHLWQVEKLCPDVRILVANQRFLNELARDPRYARVRHFPRMFLESPIDPESVSTEKVIAPPIRIGKHSLALDSKFNPEHLQLIQAVNARHGGRIEWDFMGVPAERKTELGDVSNVICRPAFSLPLAQYLRGIHIFLFFVSWKRQEPWARAVAEAMMSGCPILATDADGGNRIQVLDGSNGFLCDSAGSFTDRLCELIENPDRLRMLGRNSRIYARAFTSEAVIRKLLDFAGVADD